MRLPMLLTTCFSVGLFALPVSAQPRRDDPWEGVKKLEAELSKLRDQVRATEEKLKKARESAERSANPGPMRREADRSRTMGGGPDRRGPALGRLSDAEVRELMQLLSRLLPEGAREGAGPRGFGGGSMRGFGSPMGGFGQGAGPGFRGPMGGGAMRGFDSPMGGPGGGTMRGFGPPMGERRGGPENRNQRGPAPADKIGDIEKQLQNLARELQELKRNIRR